jgi:hypothetical protein
MREMSDSCSDREGMLRLGAYDPYIEEINTKISKVCKISRNAFQKYVQVSVSGAAFHSSLYLFFSVLAPPIPY